MFKIKLKTNRGNKDDDLTDSLFTRGAISWGLLLFPSMCAKEHLEKSKKLREEAAACHQKTLKLQKEMHEVLYREKNAEFQECKLRE